MNASRIKGLYAIADKDWNPYESLPELIGKFLVGGCKIIQLRMKTQTVRREIWNGEAYDVAKDVMKLKRRFDFTFIINDYVDVAAELRADGVHVGKNDMPIAEIRRHVKDRLLIGYSSHSLEEALEAQKEGADYVALGAVYPTRTKGPGHPVVGIDMLRTAASMLQVPVVAIGGINRNNIKEVFESGASAAAMITSLTSASDVVSETRWFVENIK